MYGKKDFSGFDCACKYRYRDIVFYALGQSERFSNWGFEAINW